MNAHECESVLALMDKARDLCKTDANVARRLVMTRDKVARVRAGRRGLTVKECARLGLLLGVEPQRVLAIQAIEREPEPEVRNWLQQVFFTAAVLGVVCLPLTANPTGPEDHPTAKLGLSTLYTLWSVVCVIFAELRRSCAMPSARALWLRH